MKPYHEHVAEVIREEFAQQGLTIRDLPSLVQEALNNITWRIADDMQYLTLPHRTKGT